MLVPLAGLGVASIPPAHGSELSDEQLTFTTLSDPVSGATEGLFSSPIAETELPDSELLAAGSVDAATVEFVRGGAADGDVAKWEEISTKESPVIGIRMVQLEGASEWPVQTLVKDAIAFEEWLIPFDDVVTALGLTVSVLANGNVEVRSSEMVTQVDFERLTHDPDLGMMWSIAQIESQLATSAYFDFVEHSIRFNQAARYEVQPETAETQEDATVQLVRSYLAEASSEEMGVAYDVVDEIDESWAAGENSGTAVENAASSAQTVVHHTFEPMLVGLMVGEIETVAATLVRGEEDGTQAIAFEQWLVPFDDAMTALGYQVTERSDGWLEVRGIGLATLFNPDWIEVDTELGEVISISTLEEVLDVSASFSFEKYAVVFQPIAENGSLSFASSQGDEEIPVVLEGLPFVEPSGFTVSGVQQSLRVNSNGFSDGLSSPVGQLTAVGNAFDGSWYTRLEQSNFTDASSWQLRELQYLRQTETLDLAMGTQPTFWQNQGEHGDYWGATAIARWGFEPHENTGGGFSPAFRMQANEVGRTIVGEADPGTLVQLTQGIHGAVVADVIVDSSGVYRFEDVPANGNLPSRYSHRGLLLKLYENGRLASEPEIRSATFTTLAGQLPAGASALIASVGAGTGRERNRFIDEWDAFQGGLSFRYGLNESLTVGAGIVQEGSAHLLTEAFYLPEALPLTMGVSALTNLQTGEVEVDAQVDYQVSREIALSFDSDRLSQRFSANWKPSPHVTLSVRGDNRQRAVGVGARMSRRIDDWHLNGSVFANTQNRLSWNVGASNYWTSFSHRGNEVSTTSQLVYRLRNERQLFGLFRGHELALTYETFNRRFVTGVVGSSWRDFEHVASGQRDRLALAEWRYRSSELSRSGQSRWQASLGYGIGSAGSGFVASASAAIGNGLDLRLRYREISPFSDEESFQISLVSRLNPQGFSDLWGHSEQDNLRSQGGLVIQPFVDGNGNGAYDAGELVKVESPEVMFRLNHEFVEGSELTEQSDGLVLMLPPDTYRLDMEPLGLPPDYGVDELAHAVEVVEGQYTWLPVPLSVSYTVSGIVFDEDGLAKVGARVEVIGESGHRQASVTNRAGVYYLDQLQGERYRIEVDGVPLADGVLDPAGGELTYTQRNLQL